MQSFSIVRNELVHVPKAFALLQLPDMTSLRAARYDSSSSLSIALDSGSPSSVDVLTPATESFAGSL